MRLNLNDSIKVKLTEHGKDIYYHQYDRLNNAFGKQLCKPSMPKVDEDGYTTFQLWCFMELYGVHMGMTLPNVIEPLDIVFDAPTIDPVKKGKWLWNLADNGWADHTCSECGWTKNTDIHVGLGYKFCPNCGAKMEEGDQDG